MANDTRVGSARSLVFVALAAIVAGCDADKVDAVEDADASDATDARSDGDVGEVGEVGDVGDVGTADTASADSGPCTKLYVDSTSATPGDGCSPKAAFTTITAAINAARVTPTVTDIDVCAGDYAEPGIELNVPVGLHGGFDCKTWKRASGFGYPSFSDGNVTKIEATGSAVNTLHVDFAGGTTALLVDGFTIVGPASGSAQTFAVLIDTATLTFRDSIVLGGGGTSGSVGLALNTGSSATVTACQIDGGSGSTTNTVFPAVGVLFASGAGNAVVTGNTINGGKGSSSASNTGSVGVAINGGTPSQTRTVSGNKINGGSGSVTATGANGSQGVNSSGPGTLILDRNQIDGGLGTGGTICPAGIELFSTGLVTVSNNTIYGGVCGLANPVTGTIGATFALPTGMAPPVSGHSTSVFNNVIHGGDSTSATSMAGAEAVRVARNGPITLAHNTLIAGIVSGTTGARPTDLHVFGKSQGITLENNLMLGAGSSVFGMAWDDCPWDGGALVAFQNNGLFNLDGGVMYESTATKSSTCAGGQTFADVASWIASAPTTGAPPITGNALLRAGCTTAQCVNVAQCPYPLTGASCQQHVFTSWNVGSFGRSDLASPADFAPGASAPCAVAHGGLNLDATYPTDLLGNKRGTAPSMGALEITSAGACTP